jgi:hypothetical protein
MYKCCQLRRPCAKIDKADLAHCAKRVGLEEISRMRLSLSKADSSLNVFWTPKTRIKGRIDDDVTDSTTDDIGDSNDVGSKKREVSTCSSREMAF